MLQNLATRTYHVTRYKNDKTLILKLKSTNTYFFLFFYFWDMLYNFSLRLTINNDYRYILASSYIESDFSTRYPFPLVLLALMPSYVLFIFTFFSHDSGVDIR